METKEFIIVGVSVNEDQVEFLTEQDDILNVPIALAESYVPAGQDIENYFLNVIPVNLKLTCCGTQVQKME